MDAWLLPILRPVTGFPRVAVLTLVAAVSYGLPRAPWVGSEIRQHVALIRAGTPDGEPGDARPRRFPS